MRWDHSKCKPVEAFFCMSVRLLFWWEITKNDLKLQILSSVDLVDGHIPSCIFFSHLVFILSLMKHPYTLSMVLLILNKKIKTFKPVL